MWDFYFPLPLIFLLADSFDFQDWIELESSRKFTFHINNQIMALFLKFRSIIINEELFISEI